MATGERSGPTGRTRCIAPPIHSFTHLDPDAGRFSFDLFEHDGGRVTEWARRNPVGQTVGLTGPGGGDLPAGQHLLIAGDETALPAIRRILSLSPRDRIGTALIEVAREEDRLDLEAPTGMQVHWLIRNRGAHWIDSLVNRPVPADGSSRFVWCAAELSQVRTAKAYFRDTLGLPRSEGYFSGFWSRSVAPQG
jgi:NADPH-dependent ferric siderophore reductase